MNDLNDVLEKLKQFRDDRDWSQFHNAKDLSLAISIEAGELLELFLWKSADEANVQKIKEELADIFSFSLLLADKYNLDVKQIILEKINANELKYPVIKSKGNARKYTEL